MEGKQGLESEKGRSFFFGWFPNGEGRRAKKTERTALGIKRRDSIQ